LQAFGPSNPETLQSQNHRRFKIRLSVKGLQVVHSQLTIFNHLRLLSAELVLHRGFDAERFEEGLARRFSSLIRLSWPLILDGSSPAKVRFVN
jgi:hypothetical protein